ncbi:MAG: redoxin domain-containing protein [Clostridia bacterium]
MYPEFQNRNCCLLGLSIDSNPSHLSWVHNIHKTTGVQIPFPVISDLNMKISKKYGMIAPNTATTKTIRNVYFIDPEQKIRAILQYPLTAGRNTGEILRLLDSLQITDKENVVTPANWLPGQPTIIPAPKTYSELMDRIKNPMGYNCMDWYLCFNQESSLMQPGLPNPCFMPNNLNCNMNFNNECKSNCMQKDIRE